MAENHNEEEKKDIDPDFEKAQKSMAGRVDPDPVAPKKEDETPPAKDPKDVTPEPEKKPEETPKADDPDKQPDKDPDDPDIKNPKRPEAFIPMKKYHDEQRDWETKLTTADERAKVAEAKVAELSSIAGQRDGVQKDEDIEAFMKETGFDRATVDGFLKLAGSRLLKPEQVEALETAEKIVKEAKIEEAYEKEFNTLAVPELKKQFPTASEVQLEKAKKFLDQAAHTKEFHDKPLDFVIWKHQADIEKLFGEVGDKKDDVPQTKKTIEGKNPGNGKPTSVTAKDFDGVKDFSSLDEMDPTERAALIKDFPTATYENFKVWVAGKNTGTEVTRNGQKVMLK